MCHLASDARPNRVLQAGLIALAVANVARYVIERHALLPASLADGVSGLFLGVAIGLLVLGLSRRRHASRRSPAA